MLQMDILLQSKVEQYISDGTTEYWINGHIATTAMSSVYKVNDGYVLKYISFAPDQSDREYRISNFKREVDTQNFVAECGLAKPIIDAWITDKGCCMVMELLHETVGKRIKRDKYRASALMKRVIGLIGQLNEHGCVHNDLHLNNIMLDASDNMYFIDFGACLSESEVYSVQQNYIDLYEYMGEFGSHSIYGELRKLLLPYINVC